MKIGLCSIVIMFFLSFTPLQASIWQDFLDGRNPLVEMRAMPIPTEISEKPEVISIKASNTSTELLNDHIKVERQKHETIKQKQIAAEKYKQYHRNLVLWKCHHLLSNPIEEKSSEAKKKNIETLSQVLIQVKKVVEDGDYLLSERLEKIDKIVNPQWERDYCCCPYIPGREAILKQMAQLKQKIGNILKEEDNQKITAFQKGLKVGDFLSRQSTEPILQQTMDRGLSLKAEESKK